LDKKFTVGDGKFYGGYYNAPLGSEGDIHVSLGLVSFKDGVRKTSFAHATHDQHGVVVLDVGPSKKINIKNNLIL
jgi:hypothetical protein